MTGEWKAGLAESIRKWEARPRYTEITPETLAAIPDDLVEQSVIDFILNFREWPEDRLVRLLRGLPVGFATLPEGTPIAGIDVEWVQPKPWWKFW